jgi:hypothetical protein
MKKSLLFGLLAVLAAVFIFTACDNGTTSTEKGDPYPEPTPIKIDVVVTTETDLRDLIPGAGAPADSSKWKDKIIGLNPSTSPLALTADLTIPEDYTVYVFGNKTLKTSAGFGLTVKGNLEVGAGGIVSVADGEKPIIVKDGGNITIDDEGNLSLFLISDINDGETKPVTVVGDTSKVKVEGGTLTLQAFTKLADLEKAFASVESGLLNVTGIKPVKPSEITSFAVTKDRKMTVEVSKVETETSLNIPEGLDLTAYGNLPLVTGLTVDGTFKAIGNLPLLADLTINNGTFNSTGIFTGLKTLIIGADGNSNLSGARLPALETLEVNGKLVTDASTVLPGLPGGVTVKVGEDGTLTLGGTTGVLKDSTIDGKLIVPTGATVTVGTNAVLTIVNPTQAYIEGPGSIVALGGTTGGTITVGSEDALTGYTTKSGGITGTAFPSAVRAIDSDYTRLMIRTGLHTSFGTNAQDAAIGSTTIASDSTPAVVYMNGNGTTSGSDKFLLNTGSDLVQSTLASFPPSVDISGTDGGAGNTITATTTFTPAVINGELTIVDSGWVTPSDLYVILTFKNLLPANGNLIGPEDYVVSFSVGVITGRT